MKNFLFLIWILFPSELFGQDTVITQKNDTLLGTAKILTYDNIDRVQINNGKNKNQYTAIQVKTVIMNQEVYHPMRTAEGYQFMKLVSSGFLSLYLGRRPGSLIFDDQYLVKRNGDVLEVPNLTFKKTIGNFLEDCNGFRQKIKDKDLGIKDLNTIITEYNLCIERQTQASQTPSVVGLEDPKMIALSNLRSKLIGGTVSVSTDTLDMLDDITDKVRNQKPVPNYLLDGLKELLKDNPACQSELNQVIKLLKNP